MSFTDFQLMRAHQLDCRTDRRLEEIVEFAVQAGFEATELDVRGHIKTPDNVASGGNGSRSRSWCTGDRLFLTLAWTDFGQTSKLK